MKATMFDAWRLGTFEIMMEEEDANHGHHQGRCDEDVTELVDTGYIRRQLDGISSEQIREVLKDYGIEDVDEMDRRMLETFIVWLAAGDIVDGYCEDVAV